MASGLVDRQHDKRRKTNTITQRDAAAKWAAQDQEQKPNDKQTTTTTMENDDLIREKQNEKGEKKHENK